VLSSKLVQGSSNQGQTVDSAIGMRDSRNARIKRFYSITNIKTFIKIKDSLNEHGVNNKKFVFF